MQEQLKESDVWDIDQPSPSGHLQRRRERWSVPTSSDTNNRSEGQNYLIKKAVGIVNKGMPIEAACARVWGSGAVTTGLIQDVAEALTEEK